MKPPPVGASIHFHHEIYNETWVEMALLEHCQRRQDIAEGGQLPFFKVGFYFILFFPPPLLSHL